MTLVLETETGISPDTDAAISEVLSQYGLMQHEPPLTMGEHSFYYYYTTKEQDADAAAAALLPLTGVNAAYIKPEGTPPA